jgi:hypothetical protein
MPERACLGSELTALCYPYMYRWMNFTHEPEYLVSPTVYGDEEKPSSSPILVYTYSNLDYCSRRPMSGVSILKIWLKLRLKKEARLEQAKVILV